MPLTVEEYIAIDPWCRKLRAEVEDLRARAAGRPYTTGAIGARAEARLARAEAEARRLWDAGLAGWMSFAEAQAFVAELNAEALARGLAATASVEQPPELRGHVVLIFAGGPHGRHRLAIGTTSPVRARKHWAGYLAACEEWLSDAT